MPKNTSSRTPSYRLHKPSGRAVVTLNGVDHYLGKWNTKASRDEYDGLIAEWLTSGRRMPSADGGGGITIVEVANLYWKHVQSYYVKSGRPTSEQGSIKQALTVVKQLYGKTLANEFGPLRLRAVRDAMVKKDWCRKQVNKQADRVRRMFKWAAEFEHLPGSIYENFRCVSGLRKGRTAAKESKRIRPVPDEYVDAIQPFVSRQVWGMIEVQRITGMRGGEVCSMRAADIDMTGRLWVYVPQEHKTEHHDKPREVMLGPKAQKVVREFLKPDTEAYLFDPRDAEDARNAEKRQKRKTPMTPSHRRRAERAKRRKRQRPPLERYTSDSYRRAITRACDKADEAAKDKLRKKNPECEIPERIIPRWHPHQLRHAAATRIRKEFGIEAARVILGHSSGLMTEIYAEADRGRAAETMLKIG